MRPLGTISADVMLGWKGEGKMGNNCPKVIMTIPYAVKDHRPIAL